MSYFELMLYQIFFHKRSASPEGLVPIKQTKSKYLMSITVEMWLPNVDRVLLHWTFSFLFSDTLEVLS